MPVELPSEKVGLARRGVVNVTNHTGGCAIQVSWRVPLSFYVPARSDERGGLHEDFVVAAEHFVAQSEDSITEDGRS
jgi:hypothetical protein